MDSMQNKTGIGLADSLRWMGSTEPRQKSMLGHMGQLRIAQLARKADWRKHGMAGHARNAAAIVARLEAPDDLDRKVFTIKEWGSTKPGSAQKQNEEWPPLKHRKQPSGMVSSWRWPAKQVSEWQRLGPFFANGKRMGQETR